MTKKADGDSGCNARVHRIAKYTRLFFQTIQPEELNTLMISGNQTALVLEIHKRGTISAIVRSIARARGAVSANAETEMVDTVDDYIQTAMVELLGLADRKRLKLHLSPGEVAGYICQWIEQKITRRIKSEFRSRNTLAEKTKDIERYSSTAPAFDDVLIARHAAMSEETDQAEIIDIREGKKGTSTAAAEETRKQTAAKVINMKDLKSRPYQIKAKKSSLEGVFTFVRRGLGNTASPGQV